VNSFLKSGWIFHNKANTFNTSNNSFLTSICRGKGTHWPRVPRESIGVLIVDLGYCLSHASMCKFQLPLVAKPILSGCCCHIIIIHFLTDTWCALTTFKIMRTQRYSEPRSPSANDENPKIQWTTYTGTFGFTLSEEAPYIEQYLNLRSILSLNNPQNNEIKFCENMKLTCWNSS
jgi:hypothetical protein